MINIKGLPITLSPTLIHYNWDRYQYEYENVESHIGAASSPLANNIDKYTGGFVIDKNVLNSYEDSFVRELFINANGKYSIDLGTSILLRGKNYYPGILSEDHHQLVVELQKDLNKFLELRMSITQDENILLYLGYLDYLKNHLLVLRFAISHVYQEIQIDDSLFDQNLRKLDKAIEHISDVFWNTYTTQQINLIDEIFLKNLEFDEVFGYLLQFSQNLKTSKPIISKFIRRHREANNPEKLYKFGELLSSEFIPADTVLVGLEYGGIELPYLLNSFRSIHGKVKLKKASLKLSGYSVNDLRKVTNVADTVSPIDRYSDIANSKRLLILDDSVMTGRTIEELIKLLPHSIKEVFLAFVSFRASNRYHHLSRAGHGGINPLVVSMSPIANIANVSATVSHDSYTDENGVFDIDKYKTFKLIEQYANNETSSV